MRARKKLKRIKCHSVEVKKWRDEIFLMYKVISGKGDNSYGIHAAMLSGIPRPIIDRAKEIAREKDSTVHKQCERELR